MGLIEMERKKHKIVEWLQLEQKKLQTRFKTKITKQRGSIYDFRGVWITVTCACGSKRITPFHIRDNGTCPECNKLVFRAMKTSKHIIENDNLSRPTRI